jgi:ribosomal protein S27E
MRCPNCGNDTFRDVFDDAAEGGIVACTKCDLAVDPDGENVQMGGVAPVPTDVVPVLRPDTGEDGRGLVTELPTPSASREEWDAAAETLGFDPAEFSNKDLLIEALTAHVESVPDTSLNAPEPDGAQQASTRVEDQ